MTYEQIKFTIEQIRKFENQKKETTHEKMCSLIERCQNYYTEINFNNLFIRTFSYCYENITQEEYVQDCNTMIFTLQGLLDKDKNYPIVRDIIKEIENFRSKSKNSIKESIKKIYFTYSDRIKFSKIIEKMIAEDINHDPFTIELGDNGFNKNLLESMLKTIENYANDLCNGKITKTTPTKSDKLEITVNNTNNNTLTQTTEINIEIEFENAVKQIEEACLPDVQEKEVLTKLQELKEILEAKTTRRAKWDKVKEFFKWVAEQGIQVASVVVPLLTNTIK